MKILTSLILSFFAAAASAQSRMVTEAMPSRILDTEREYTIYLPPSFDADTTRHYPILYLLHGMTDTNTSWQERGHYQEVVDELIAKGEIPEMVIVTPNAGGANVREQQNGYFNLPEWRYEDFFFEEFMPAIESKYRAGGSKEKRAVAGLSMGGGGATGYAQHHPELFASAYAMSALMDIPEFDWGNAQADDKFVKLTRSVMENSCVRYVAEATDAQKDALRTVRWYIDCGDDDFLLECNMDFYREMRRARIPAEMRMRDGGHSWDYWHSALYTALPFAF